MDHQYLCETMMKPSNARDRPHNYRVQRYWSKFTDQYDIQRRVRYLWIAAQLERLMMRLFGNIKTRLVKLPKDQRG